MIYTRRTVLRQWRADDEAEMAAVNRDPAVSQYLNRPVDDAAVGAFYGVMVQHWRDHGFGPWVVESTEPSTRGEFLGFAGLAHLPPFLAAAGRGPELGWRLKQSAWGRGLATEAAAAARDDAVGRVGVDELISVIHPANVRSQRVAIKLGMTLDRQAYNPVLERDVDVWVLRSDVL